MPKPLKTIAALLLAPCLAAPPQGAALGSISPYMAGSPVSRCSGQALSLRSLSGLHNIIGRYPGSRNTGGLFKEEFPRLHTCRGVFFGGQLTLIIAIVFG